MFIWCYMMCMSIWVSIPTLFGAPSILYAIQYCTLPNEFLARSNMSPSLPRMINFQMRRWIFGGASGDVSKDVSLSCNVNVKAGDILLPPGDTQLSWKIMICKNVERFFLGYDLRVLLQTFVSSSNQWRYYAASFRFFPPRNTSTSIMTKTRGTFVKMRSHSWQF